MEGLLLKEIQPTSPLPGWYYIQNGELYEQWKHAYKKELENLKSHQEWGLSKQKLMKEITEWLEKRKQNIEPYSSINEIDLDWIGFSMAHHTLENFDMDYLKALKQHHANLLEWKKEMEHPLVVHNKQDRLKYLPHDPIYCVICEKIIDTRYNNWTEREAGQFVHFGVCYNKWIELNKEKIFNSRK